MNSLVAKHTFYVRNTDNGQGLPGALIEAHIELDNQIIDTIHTVSAQNGEVSLPVPDKGLLFMKGTHLGYHDSTLLLSYTQIASVPEEEKTLWLRPQPIPATIWIKDTITGKPVMNANVSISCDGNLISSARSGSLGEVYIGGFPIDCNVLVSVKHPDYDYKEYKTDIQQIQRDSVCYLRPQHPPGPAPIDCSPQSDGRTKQREPAVRQTYFMGKSQGVFTFKYNTYSQSDRIEIFCGKKKVWEYEGATGMFIGGDKREKISFTTPYIEVVVTGSTAWDYTVFCPE
ncbi:MAG: hypothetical protein R2795_25580 [Saprospiraceae bacterium]